MMGELETGSEVAIRVLLRAHGLPVTTARIAVLQVLQRSSGHLSAEEVHAAVLGRYPSLNLVTVYRTLETFADRGLAVKAVLGDKLVRWEHAEQPHHHLVCSHCGGIVELDDAPFQRLAADLERGAGVRVAARHLSLSGLCAACAGADDAS